MTDRFVVHSRAREPTIRTDSAEEAARWQKVLGGPVTDREQVTA